MPISDVPDYSPGHFNRVYEYIIKPSVIKAGFGPIRADEVKQTNFIVIDILKRIINSEMAVCDLSSRNPNVLYELGIRQAFNLPVTLVKDELTNRIFDIQGFRDFEYPSNLRIDEVNASVKKLSEFISTTYESFNNKDSQFNSIIDLLKINKAQISGEINLSPETNLIFQQLQDIRFQINNLNHPNPLQRFNRTIPRFELFKGANDNYYFHLKDRNGEVVLASQGYSSKQACKDGIDSITNLGEVRFEKRIGKSEKFYFLLIKDKIIGNSQMYSSPAERDNGIQEVYACVKFAEFVDLVTEK